MFSSCKPRLELPAWRTPWGVCFCIREPKPLLDSDPGGSIHSAGQTNRGDEPLLQQWKLYSKDISCSPCVSLVPQEFPCGPEWELRVPIYFHTLETAKIQVFSLFKIDTIGESTKVLDGLESVTITDFSAITRECSDIGFWNWCRRCAYQEADR